MTDQITRRITDTLTRVPGYTGYRAKEDRRDADRRVREKVATDLAELARRVEGIAAASAQARDIHAVGAVGDLASTVRLLADRVTAASYGYGGLFGDRDVDEAAIAQLHEFDSGLLQRVADLDPFVSAVETASDPTTRTAAIAGATAAVDSLLRHLRDRADVIETGRPSPLTNIASPLAVLQPTTPDPPPPIDPPAAIGDAVSLAGANFVVDALIEVIGPESATLIRIEITPERWLLMAADGRVADLGLAGAPAEIAATAPPSPGGGSARSRVTGVAGKSGERSVSFAVTWDGPSERPVSVTLDWGQDALRLAGTIVAPDDVEVYRRQP